MRILLVADVESKYLYDYYHPDKLRGYDLIISCGDLPAEYLEFLVTMAGCPLLYVHGNHDEYPREPDGCICIDDMIVEVCGLRIMGLGGSFRYRDGKYMFTENAMKRRMNRLRRKAEKLGGVDMLITHAPARHVNDFETLPHRGFECFTDFLREYKPDYFIHGHIHKSYGHIPRTSSFEETTVVNAYEHFPLSVKEREPKSGMIAEIVPLAGKKKYIRKIRKERGQFR